MTETSCALLCLAGAPAIAATKIRFWCLRLCAYVPTRIREREWKSPKVSSSHNTTPMTTTAFKIDLMVPCIGMKRFTSHNKTPTTIRVNRICMRGIALIPFLRCCETLPDWFFELLHALDGARRSRKPLDFTDDWTVSPARVSG